MDDEIDDTSTDYNYWKEKFNNLNIEFDEFQTTADLLQQELEAQLEQTEIDLKEKTKQYNAIFIDHNNYKDKMEPTVRENLVLIEKLQTENFDYINRHKFNMTVQTKLEQNISDLEDFKRQAMTTIATLENRIADEYERNALLEADVELKKDLEVECQRYRDQARDLAHNNKVQMQRKLRLDMGDTISTFESSVDPCSFSSNSRALSPESMANSNFSRSDSPIRNETMTMPQDTTIKPTLLTQEKAQYPEILQNLKIKKLESKQNLEHLKEKQKEREIMAENAPVMNVKNVNLDVKMDEGENTIQKYQPPTCQLNQINDKIKIGSDLRYPVYNSHLKEKPPQNQLQQPTQQSTCPIPSGSSLTQKLTQEQKRDLLSELYSQQKNIQETTLKPTKNLDSIASTHREKQKPKASRHQSQRQCAVTLVGDLLNKIGVLEHKLSSCRKFIKDSPWRDGSKSLKRMVSGSSLNKSKYSVNSSEMLVNRKGDEEFSPQPSSVSAPHINKTDYTATPTAITKQKSRHSARKSLYKKANKSCNVINGCSNNDEISKENEKIENGCLKFTNV